MGRISHWDSDRPIGDRSCETECSNTQSFLITIGQALHMIFNSHSEGRSYHSI